MDKINYLKALFKAGLVATAPKTSDPNSEELVFFETVPDDLLDLRRVTSHTTAEWHLIVSQRPSSDGYSELGYWGITVTITKDIDAARKAFGVL